MILLFGGFIFVSFIVINLIAPLFAPPLPDYSDPNDPSLWKNTLTDASGITWTYRKEIQITNPNTNNASGTYSFDLPFYQPWFGDKEIFKVDDGIVKIVQAEKNPLDGGADLLYDIPAMVVASSTKSIRVFFNYEVPGNATNSYFIYYKQSKQTLPNSLIDNPIGFASIGGFSTDFAKCGFVTVGTVENSTSNDYLGILDSENRWPYYKNYQLGGLNGNKGGFRTTSPIAVANKYVRTTGLIVSGKNYNQTFLMGFYDGAGNPSTGLQSGNFTGIELRSTAKTYSDDFYITDLFIHNSNFTRSTFWSYSEESSSDSDFDGYEALNSGYMFEFTIDENRNLEFILSDNVLNPQKIKRVNLGIIPWDTIYFQASSTYGQFTINSVVVAPGDLYLVDQLNGVKISEGYEVNLSYAQSLNVENMYTFVIGIICISFVFFYIIGFFIPGREKIAPFFEFFLIFLSGLFIIRYHPARFVIGVENEYLYVGQSLMGIEIMARAGEVHPIFYYFLYFALPLSVILFVLNRQKDWGFSTRNNRVKTILPLLFSGFLILFFFLPSQLISASFFIMSIGIFVLLRDTIKSGLIEGINSKNNKKLNQILSKLSFFYFLATLVVQSYQSMNVIDPFFNLDPILSFGVENLGGFLPILISLKIPMAVIAFLGIVFSKYITVLILGLIFIKSAVQAEGTVLTRINSAIWVIYLWFGSLLIRFPFFSLILSMLYVAGWFSGNTAKDNSTYLIWMKQSLR